MIATLAHGIGIEARCELLWRELEHLHAMASVASGEVCHGFALVGGGAREDRRTVRLAAALADAVSLVRAPQGPAHGWTAALLRGVIPVALDAPNGVGLVVVPGGHPAGGISGARAALAAWRGEPAGRRDEIIELGSGVYACSLRRLFLALARELPHVAHLHVFEAIAELERDHARALASVQAP